MSNGSIRFDAWLSLRRRDTEVKENQIGTEIVDWAVRLHRELGPGLLEAVYEATLGRALEQRGLEVHRQAVISIQYQGMTFDEGLRADLTVGGWVIVELRSVDRINPAPKKQLLTYTPRRHEIGNTGLTRRREDAKDSGRKSSRDRRVNPK